MGPARTARPAAPGATVLARVTDDAGPLVLPPRVLHEFGLASDQGGRIVVRATVAGQPWTTEAAAGPAGVPARVGAGTLEVHGFRLPSERAAAPETSDARGAPVASSLPGAAGSRWSAHRRVPPAAIGHPPERTGGASGTRRAAKP